MDSTWRECSYNIICKKLPRNLHTLSKEQRLPLRTSTPAPILTSPPTTISSVSKLVLFPVRAQKRTIFVHTSFYDIHGEKAPDSDHLWIYTSLPGPKKEHRILWKCSINTRGKRILVVDWEDIRYSFDSTNSEDLEKVSIQQLSAINPLYLENHLVALYEFARAIHRDSIMIPPGYGRIILLSK